MAHLHSKVTLQFSLKGNTIFASIVAHMGIVARASDRRALPPFTLVQNLRFAELSGPGNYKNISTQANRARALQNLSNGCLPVDISAVLAWF